MRRNYLATRLLYLLFLEVSFPTGLAYHYLLELSHPMQALQVGCGSHQRAQLSHVLKDPIHSSY